MITKSYVFDIKLQQRQETRAMLEHGRAVLEGRDIGNQYGVSCPDCYAANTKRIPYIPLVFLRCVALPGEVFLSQVRLHTVYAIKKQGSSFIPKHPQSVPGQRSAFIQFPLQSVLLVSVCLKCLLLFCNRFYWCKKRSQAGLREVLSRLKYINHHAA